MATTLELSFKLESDLCNNVDWGRKWFTNFNTGKAQLVSLEQSNKSGATDMKIGLFLKKIIL